MMEEVSMQVATQSSMVWKRESDEQRRWSRIFVRVSVALAVAFLATGAYAYATHVQYRVLCATLEQTTKVQPAPSVLKVNDPIIRDHCRS
jgi:type VI protein secretion system component VasF